MTRKDLDDERNSKKELGIKDFNLLVSDGTIAFYKECELTHIFLIENATRKHYHYFAILSYEEFKEVDKSLFDKNITASPIKINKKFKLGICQMRISFEDAANIFNQLCSDTLTFKKINFVIPNEIQLLPKTYIPSLWGYNSAVLNKVLKPNFWGDKYILEFISLKNPINDIFLSNEIETINAEILKLLSIDLASVYDRIGSFIFQFPITILSGQAKISKDWCKAQVSMKAHPDFQFKDDLCTIVKTSIDNIETGFHSYNGYYDNIELDLGDSNNLELKIYNKKNGLIYKSSMGNFIRNFSLNMGIGSQNSEPRIFIDSDGHRNEVNLVSYSTSVSSESVNYDSRTKNRIMQNEIINKSGRFLNINPGERAKALEYIRELLKQKAPSSAEIWLWDPFLRQSDIFNTLYFVNCSGIKMKCITSYKKDKRLEDKKKPFSEFTRDEKNKFFKFSENHLGIVLEFRVVYIYGFDFHDRFLFFIPKEKEELPTVFSLGTSINSLGLAHHLIQQTLDPREIIKSFEKLWELLDNDESIIIKLPEELKK